MTRRVARRQSVPTAVPRVIEEEALRIAGEQRRTIADVVDAIRRGHDAAPRDLLEVERWGIGVGVARRAAAPVPPTREATTEVPAGPAPPLEEFDQELGEVFAATDSDGKPDIGIVWVVDGRIVRTTLSAELHRIGREYDQATQGHDRTSEEARAEREKEVKRLLRSLPFTRVRDALWPLPNDPTTQSVAEWEAENGSLLSALVTYFAGRVSTNDADGHLLLALWAMGASARSPEIDYAPRLMFEAPFGWGKSTVAEAVQLVVPRGVNGASLTAAAVYRMMNEWHPVLLVDESAITDTPGLLQVLRTGYKRGTKIIRAAQNVDRGVVLVDPFGWEILTTQVDTKEDLVSRCYMMHLSPGTPEKRVTIRDPEAAALRTVLVRLRLDILAGTAYPDIASTSEAARSKPGLEPRSRDKLTALWPFAVRYGVEDRLVAAAGRLEEEAAEQLAGSDKGLVVAAIAAVVAQNGGLVKLKPAELELRWIQEEVERLLKAEGEATMIPGPGGEVVARIDLKRYGPRDFTARIVRELGFQTHTVHGKTRLDIVPFIALWPHVWVRYGGTTTIDELAEKGGVPRENTPPMPPRTVLPPIEKLASTGSHPYPTPEGGVPTLKGGGVGIRAPDLAPPPAEKSPSPTASAVGNASSPYPDPEDARSGPTRPRHPHCRSCVDQAYHVCYACEPCRWQETYGGEREP